MKTKTLGHILIILGILSLLYCCLLIISYPTIITAKPCPSLPNGFVDDLLGGRCMPYTSALFQLKIFAVTAIAFTLNGLLLLLKKRFAWYFTCFQIALLANIFCFFINEEVLDTTILFLGIALCVFEVIALIADKRLYKTSEIAGLGRIIVLALIAISFVAAIGMLLSPSTAISTYFDDYRATNAFREWIVADISLIGFGSLLLYSLKK